MVCRGISAAGFFFVYGSWKDFLSHCWEQIRAKRSGRCSGCRIELSNVRLAKAAVETLIRIAPNIRRSNKYDRGEEEGLAKTGTTVGNILCRMNGVSNG